jgi:phosphoribosylamine--glycine ligase
MNVLILGGGGREHAFALKIQESPLCDSLHVAPGNAGTAQIAHNHNIDILDFGAVKAVVESEGIDTLLVGPEAPLVAGITDYFAKEMPELLVIGPGREGAQLEGSKAYAKEFMAENNIPTAAYLEVTLSNIHEGYQHIDHSPGPYVLKADGLAAGKGVLIIEDRAAAKKSLEEMLNGQFGAASKKVVIEAFLDGIEFSVFVLTDGKYYSLLPVAKDYKRIGEGDTGPNTGGMGAVSPVPFVDYDMMTKVKNKIIIPTLTGLQKRNIKYNGFIFLGLIVVDNEPYVIEYNCRMGDPETEVVLPRLNNDLLELFEALKTQNLHEISIDKTDGYTTTVVMVSGGYPATYDKGYPIQGLEEVTDSIVYHSGTKQADASVDMVTNGGRVLAITSTGASIDEAVNKSLASIDKIKFEKKNYRKDIGFDL